MAGRGFKPRLALDYIAVQTHAYIVLCPIFRTHNRSLLKFKDYGSTLSPKFPTSYGGTTAEHPICICALSHLETMHLQYALYLSIYLCIT